MALNLESKKYIVKDINEVASQAHSVVAADYQGLNVAAMTELRQQGKKQGVYVSVVKNTLARRALQGTDYECLCDSLVGPLVLAFSKEEVGAAARLFKNFIAEHTTVEVKLISIDGEMFDVSALDRLASLPTKDTAIALLMGVIKAPIGRLASTLSAIPTGVVRVLAEIRNQKKTAV